MFAACCYDQGPHVQRKLSSGCMIDENPYPSLVLIGYSINHHWLLSLTIDVHSKLTINGYYP